ncbi:MAG TPA: ABC transporter permease [Candidatus Cybelea sp.]|jgi:putative ABC transport system permease protein|nr:ABC transporter permease [Candidatus Cybelea sp.]
MRTLLQDIRYGLRVLAKNPGFAAVAVLTLALGIGVNSAIFSLVDAVILRPLPYPEPEQLVGLGQWRNQRGEGYIQTGVSAPNIVDIAKAGIFQQVAYYRWSGFNITEGSRPESIGGIQASVELLPMFGIPPQLGRYLAPEEMQAGHDRVAIIGHSLWQMRYGSDPAILGKTIELDERRYTIVGVMPASFRFTWDQEMDVFVPLLLSEEERSEAGRGTSRDLQTQARLKARVSIPQAQAAMNALADNLALEYPAANKGWGIKVEPLHAAYHRHMQTPLLIMLGAVLFVLFIACANVANLLLARATGRKREVAIRVAMGATRRRLMAQLLTESLLLATLGGALGLLLAYAGDRLLTFAMSRYQFSLPNARVIDIDWRVLLFSLAITIATGVIFGLAPSWATAKTDLNESLKEGALSTTTESGRRRMRNALVVSEMALALVLLTGAGLLVRTFLRLVNVDLGIDPANVVTMGLRLPNYKYSSAAHQALFYRELLERIPSTPGVKSVGAESGGANVFFQPQGQPLAAPGQEPTAAYKIITPDFFQAMGTRLVTGREFSVRDAEGATPVAIISETVARRYWPHANPVGSHLTVLARVYSGQKPGADQPLEIVGVVRDVRNDDLWNPEPDVYVPFEQHPAPSVFLVVRTSVPPMSVVPGVRNAVLALDKEQPVNDIRTMSEIVSETYGAIRFPMTLLWIFAALALALSAVGIFGVMSYSVSRRTQEMAIRMVLGASCREVQRMVLREGLQVTALGVAIGLGAALALSRVMAGYVYGITSTDPLTLVGASLLLTLVALLASYLPARRATRVDPMTALRYE